MKIMYLLHIDWNWIKQRPQFIAEQLAKSNQLVCLAPHWYNRKNLQVKGNINSKVRIIEFYGMPKAKRHYLIRRVNNQIRSVFSAFHYSKYSPEVLYITHPEIYHPWMKSKKAILIYDCMDDHISLTEDERVKRLISDSEKELVKVADIVIASSEEIRNSLSLRYSINKEKIILVRNGYDGGILKAKEQVTENNGKLELGYIGTIAQWFDFETILEAAEKGVVFHIIGPSLDKNSLPIHENIIYEGVVEHKDLYNKIKDYNALIMPFKINDIVKAVDPVKLYEYINFNKPIISVYYQEISRFEPYVWFYGKDNITFLDAIEQLRVYGRKYSPSERIQILEESTWENRAKQIEIELRKYITSSKLNVYKP